MAGGLVCDVYQSTEKLSYRKKVESESGKQIENSTIFESMFVSNMYFHFCLIFVSFFVCLFTSLQGTFSCVPSKLVWLWGGKISCEICT